MPTNGVAVALPTRPIRSHAPFDRRSPFDRREGGPREGADRGRNWRGDGVCSGCDRSGVGGFEAGGRLTPATRTLGGECIGRVCELQLAMLGEIDFGTVARQEGKRVLHQRHSAAFRQHYGADLDEAALDAALDEIVGWVISIAERVVADELERAH
jgi:hypothetical protein